MHLTVRDVAQIFNVSEKSVYRWISQGKLPAYRINDQYRFNRAELLDWAAAQKVNFSPEIFTEPADSSSPVFSLSDALESGGVFYRVSGSDKQSVLKEIVSLMRLPEEVDRAFLLNVLLAREEMVSTAIGDGIAIPHVRTPIVLRVQRPMVSLCFLDRPIEYGALDKKPVDTLFTLISPTVRSHLQLLSMLSFALKDEGFRSIIAKKSLREDISNALRKVESGISSHRGE